MKVCRVSGALAGLLVASMLALFVQAVSAAVIFDDHFEGNSGGMPADWHLVFGLGTAVESGTTVTLDGGIIMATDSTFDPNPPQGPVTLTLDIASTDPLVSYLGFGFVDADATHLLLAEIHPADLRLGVSASSTGGDTWQSYDATDLNGYTYGPLTLVLILGPTAFSISSDSPPFSSGLIAYSTVFPGFTRADLGDTCNLVISQDPSSGLGPSSIDRLRLEVESQTAVRDHTFGQVKILYRR
jgi:hypothetical protein